MIRMRPVQWMRAHPDASDAALAVVVAAVSVVMLFTTVENPDLRRPDALAAALTVGSTLPIALRRRSPLRVFAAVTVCQFVFHLTGYDSGSWAGVIIALYSVGANVEPSRRRTVSFVVFLVGCNLLFAAGLAIDDVELGAVIGSNVTLPAAFVLGDNLRRRRERIADLAERAERAEREQELLARQRVNEERSRIARELHDVVAHSVSVMLIQAGAARRQLTQDPDRAAAALEAIEGSGREAMQEMRRILGVLRSADDGERSPQPSIDALDDLVASDPSLPATLTVDGERPPLPAGVELSAYRVVQEALTNVRKHAGSCTRVKVAVAYRPDGLTVVVHDDGRGGAQPSRPEPGHGLVGMRERVAACGGDLTVGPARGGGWLVEARFPIGATGAVT